MSSSTLVKSLALVAMAVSALLIPVEAAKPADVAGIWLTEGGKSKIQIKQQGSSLSGRLIWLKEPLRDGKPKLDKNNESPALRNRPLIGLTLIQGFVFKNGQWEEGKIYNPEDGKTYSCTLSLKNGSTLEVRGYVMNPILGKTQTWTRSK
ncbi:MAG: DUF2147 domain-containing protein [Candidatus Sericytochromatia bacterium]